MWNDLLNWKHSEISACLSENQRVNHPALGCLQRALELLTSCLMAARHGQLVDKKAMAAVVFADYAACYYMDVNLCGDDIGNPDGFDEGLWEAYAADEITLDQFREMKS